MAGKAQDNRQATTMKAPREDNRQSMAMKSMQETLEQLQATQRKEKHQMGGDDEIGRIANASELPELRLDENTVKAVQMSWLLFCAKKGSVDNAEGAVLGKLKNSSPEFAKMLYGAEAMGLTIDASTGRRKKREELVDEFGRRLHEDVGLRDADAEAADFALIDSMVRNKKFGEPDPKNPIKGSAFEDLLASKELNQLMVALQEAKAAKGKAGGGVAPQQQSQAEAAATLVPSKAEKGADTNKLEAGTKTAKKKDGRKVSIQDDHNPQTSSLHVIEEQSWIGTWTFGPADKQQEYSIHPNPVGGLIWKTFMRDVELACPLEHRGVDGLVGTIPGGGPLVLRMQGEVVMMSLNNQPRVSSHRKDARPAHHDDLLSNSSDQISSSAAPSRQISSGTNSSAGRAPRGIVVSL